MHAPRTFAAACTVALAISVGCGGASPVEELSFEDPIPDDSRILEGDWELDIPDEPFSGSDPSTPCALSWGGLAYINAEGEAMMGVIEMSECGDDLVRHTWNETLVFEESEPGAYKLHGTPGAAGNLMTCLLLEEDELQCAMPSPFSDRIWSLTWVRTD